MLKKLVLGVAGVGGGDTAPVFGAKVNHMVEELYAREGVDLQTNELPEARPISTGGTGATTQADAVKNILPAASARQTIRYNGADWVTEDEVTQIASDADWDTLVNAGVYYAPFVIGDGVNSPPDILAYGFLRVTRSGAWIMQEVIGDDGRKSMRFSVDGGVTWKVWSDESTTARKLLNPVKINGTDFDGTQDINIASMPMGVPIFHGGLRSTIETGYVAYDGQLLIRADYPAMWAKVQATFPIITDADWLDNPSKRGSYSSGDGTTTFRMPDYNGVQTNSLKGLFLRGDGGGTIGGVAVSSGTTVLSDAIRNITGEVSTDLNGMVWLPLASKTSGVFVSASGTPTPNTFKPLGNYDTVANYPTVLFDASRVVPTAPENRPVSAVGVWICRVGNTLTEVANPTLHAVLTGGNTFNGTQTVNGDLSVSGRVIASLFRYDNVTLTVYPTVNVNKVNLSGNTLLLMIGVHVKPNVFAEVFVDDLRVGFAGGISTPVNDLFTTMLAFVPRGSTYKVVTSGAGIVNTSISEIKEISL